MKLSSPQARADASDLSRALIFILIAIIAACVLRLTARESKPMHVDESTQAVKLHQLLEGEYEYDPRDHHGPTLLYSTVPIMALTGTRWIDMTESKLRLVPALYGIALVLLLVLVKDGMSRMSLAWAALFTAVSPLMVFYSRYYIMEVLLVVFTFGCIACGWRYYITRKNSWMAWSGICAGLMHATKETCVLHFMAMGAGLFVVYAAEFFTAGAGLTVVNRNRRSPLRARQAMLWLGCAAGASILCFSKCLTDWTAVWNSFNTYFLMLDRAGGQGHQKEFFYYLKLLWGGALAASGSPSPEAAFLDFPRWLSRLGINPSPLMILTERVILILSAIGAISAFVSKPGRQQTHHLLRFLAVYGVTTFVIYSSISYKTPWCIMGAWHALILMAGLGAQVMVNAFLNRWARNIMMAILLVLTAHMGLMAWRTTQNFEKDSRLPYNYSMTSPDVREWVARFTRFTEIDDKGIDLKITQNDPNGGWPLPWYLRKFPNYQWQGGAMDIAGSSVLLVSAAADEVLKHQLEAAGQLGAFEAGFTKQSLTLHPSQSLTVYIDEALWQKYLARAAEAPWPKLDVQQ